MKWKKYLGSFFAQADGDLASLKERIAALEARAATAMTRQGVKQMIRESLHGPNIEWPTASPTDPFMAYSNCNVADFAHPRYAQLCKLMNGLPYFHRKQWEYIFILHHLAEANVLRAGMRGVGFGVGKEPLPSAFAMLGASVLGTDAPSGIKEKGGWEKSKEHSASLESMMFPWIPQDLFYRNVSFAECDMNNIDPAIQGYDFTWSSCCLEHLGTPRKGLEFIRESVEKCLKVGGTAVHTTELNLSSITQSVQAMAQTVLYGQSELEAFVAEMRERGHHPNPIVIGPPAHALDFHVDVPPYSQDLHLRIRLAEYVTTSVGVVVRRGR